MTGTVFSLFTLPASGAPLSEASTGSVVPEGIPTEETSFFDLLQRHTSTVSAGEDLRDVLRLLQSKPYFDTQALPLSQESAAILDPEKSLTGRHHVIDSMILSDPRFLLPVEADENQFVFQNGELTQTGVDRGGDDELQHEVEGQSVMEDSQAVWSFEKSTQSGMALAHLSVDDRRQSYGVGMNGFGQTANRDLELPASPVNEYRNMNAPLVPSAQGQLPVKGPEIQELQSLKEPVAVPSPEGTKGRERIPSTDFGINEFVENDGYGSPRRFIINFDQPTFPDPQKTHSLLPRTMASVEPPVQPPAPPIPIAVQSQSVSGGSAFRPEGIGAVLGGTGSPATESLSDTSGSKPELPKIPNVGDSYGTNSDANEETGGQSGLGGFSHSPGHQSSYSQSGQLTGSLRVPEAAAPELPLQPIQRLQLDVQISETQRVQIDVGVQHRQVYAGLVMDHMALRNLALQFLPQLEEQFTNINMELSEFSAETPEEKGSETDSTFQGRTSSSETQGWRGEGRTVQRGSLPRQIPSAEAGLHFVA
ncbi:MAG: hypothetical protein R3B74_14345 [Nitrospirales bacterium]|nr:hypothetical protein [Nitrospirales bacterium]